MRNTVQGESGWYSSPEGIYYFVLEDDNWILAAGPIKQSEYERTRNALKVVNRQSSININMSMRRINSRMSFNQLDQQYLVYCPFKLAVEHELVKGDIYMSNQTEKLFVAVSVDDLITSSQIAIQHDSTGGKTAE